MESYQRGRAQSWHEPRFYPRRYIGVFLRGACPLHGTCLDFTSLKLLMWFDFLPLLGSGGLAIFLFYLFFCVFFFERDIKAPGIPAYPNHTASDSNRRECPRCCCWGWFWVHMRAPDCLDPSVKYENLTGVFF